MNGNFSMHVFHDRASSWLSASKSTKCLLLAIALVAWPIAPGAIIAATAAHPYAAIRFPDGAVLVKEVFDTATDPMTTGIVSRATTLKGWFVIVKDSKNSYPQSSL